MSIEVTDELIQKLTEEWLDTLPARYPLRLCLRKRFIPFGGGAENPLDQTNCGSPFGRSAWYNGCHGLCCSIFQDGVGGTRKILLCFLSAD